MNKNGQTTAYINFTVFKFAPADRYAHPLPYHMQQNANSVINKAASSDMMHLHKPQKSGFVFDLNPEDGGNNEIEDILPF